MVRVKSDEPMISKISRIAINTAIRSPSLLMLKIQKETSTSPLIINILIINVNAIRMKIGFSPRSMNFSGTREIAITTASPSAASAKPMKSFTTKMDTI